MSRLVQNHLSLCVCMVTFRTLRQTQVSITSLRCGAGEACWAHNPEVRGSKPRSARYTILIEVVVAKWLVP